MSALDTYRYRLARSDHPAARALKSAVRGFWRFSVPAPRVVVRPMLLVFVAVREGYYFLRRVLVAEPLFKAYCTTYGRDVHTGIYVHWIRGKGRLLVGDHVTMDGKCTIGFAARFDPNPTLTIGSHTGIGHNSLFIVGKSITIGEHCRIAENVQMFDSSGHPSDPNARLADEPLQEDAVRPIVIERNVWIGRGAMIFPGVTIGENSVVSAGSVVVSPVPANTLVMGNPARRMAGV